MPPEATGTGLSEIESRVNAAGKYIFSRVAALRGMILPPLKYY